MPVDTKAFSDWFWYITIAVFVIEVFAAFGSLCAAGYYNGFNIAFSLVGTLYFLICSALEETNLISAALSFANLIFFAPNFFFLISQIILIVNIMTKGKLTWLHTIVQFLISPEALIRFISLLIHKSFLSSLRHIAFLAAHLVQAYYIILYGLSELDWDSISKQILDMLKALKNNIKIPSMMDIQKSD